MRQTYTIKELVRFLAHVRTACIAAGAKETSGKPDH